VSRSWSVGRRLSVSWSGGRHLSWSWSRDRCRSCSWSNSAGFRSYSWSVSWGGYRFRSVVLV